MQEYSYYDPATRGLNLTSALADLRVCMYVCAWPFLRSGIPRFRADKVAGLTYLSRAVECCPNGQRMDRSGPAMVKVLGFTAARASSHCEPD